MLSGGRRRRQWAIYARARTAVRSGVDTETLPFVIRPKGDPTQHLSSPARADVVTIGKFDVARTVRLRAFYEQDGVSLRFQAGGPRNGVLRTVRAFNHVRQHAPGLMPEVFDHGQARRTSYLVEESLYGSHPRSGKPLREIAGEVASELSRLHRGYGIVEQPISDILGSQFDERWRRASQIQGIPEGVEKGIRALVAQDRLLEVSFGHGDLVGTNIMQLPDRVVLIDWEYAGKIPIGFDVAKIHLHCGNPVESLEILRKGLGRPVRDRARYYDLGEQIALAHARYIAWSLNAMARARTAGRETQLHALIGKRVNAIARLLDAS